MANKWISVKDRMPEEISVFVLVTRNTGCNVTVEAQYVNGKFISHRFGMMHEFKDPTHWMPLDELPDPPEANNGK